MERKIYKICSSSSLGYKLINIKDHNDFCISKAKKTLTYQKGNLIIGDEVCLDENGIIDFLVERRTLLTRPKIANVDYVLIVISCKEPNYSSYLLDKFLLTINYSSITPIIVFSKFDLLDEKEKELIIKEKEYYESYSYKCFCVSKNGGYDNNNLINFINEKTICVMGQTGVGKSTLLNLFDSSFKFVEGDYIMTKGRGKHVTKSVILQPYKNGFIGDTPGFSSFDLVMSKLAIADNFPCFEKYDSSCKFNDCLHTSDNENICNVCFRFKNGDNIHNKHYENFLKILNEEGVDKYE